VTVNLSEIPGAFHLPRMNWDAIRAWVDKHVPEPDRPQAWADIVDQWLAVLNKALGNQYQTVATESLVVFAPRDYELAESLLRHAESGIAAITDALGALATESQIGPLVILLFADDDTYTDYIWPFFREGEYGASAGVCVRQGYVHIAAHATSDNSVQRTVLHEIKHACLSHLTLPLWLEEGVTQLAAEAGIGTWARFHLDAKTASDIRRYWRENGLGNFWWGRGFYLPDEGQLHSYRLSQVLFHLLIADHRRQLPDFVRHAHRGDAGESAAREYLGRGLADLAAQFLGEGP